MLRSFVLLLATMLTGCMTKSPGMNMVDVTQIDFTDAKQWKMGKACAVWVGPIGPLSSNSVHYAAANGQSLI